MLLLVDPTGQESFTDFPGAAVDSENESAALQQQIAAQQAFSQIPEDVLKFLVKFHQAGESLLLVVDQI